MKIIEKYNNKPIEKIEIKSAYYIGDFVIRIIFKDGSQRVVDFKQFLEKSLHPAIRKYLNERNFKKYRIVSGNLNWNDYDMIFPVADLYEGKI